jgi:gliding motility-associated-like protein
MPYSIINFPNPTIQLDTLKHVSCYGFSDAVIDVSLASGANPAVYQLLNNGSVNPNGVFVGLPSGVYTIQATDAKGCSTTMSYTITQPTPLLISSVSTTSVTCFGADDGTITIAGVGGTPPYNYNILNFGGTTNTTGFFNNLPGNTTYTTSIVDFNGCVISTALFIPEPAPVTVVVDSVHHITCFGGNDGFIKVSGYGGTSTFTYTLQPNNITNSNGNFGTLIAGTYTLVVTDANNCSITVSYTLTQPPAFAFDSIGINHVKCFGSSTGAIYVIGSGGTGQLTYSLSATNTNTTGIFSALPAGPYTITLTDVNQCSATTAVTITEPPQLAFNIFIINNVTCFGKNDGIIAATTIGGTAPYTFKLLPNPLSFNTGYFNNLAPGTYTLQATDGNSCTINSVATIVEPLPLVIDSVYTQNITCFGGDDGVIKVQGTGGTFPYTFTLLPTNIVDSTGTFIGITAGNYTVKLIDANSCDTTRMFTLTEPPAIVITSIIKLNIKCYGDSTGAIQINASGGTGALTYQLQYPGLSTSNSTGEFIGLPANTYTMIVKDARGCTISTAVQLTQNPEIILDSVRYTSPTCYGLSDGSLYVAVSGGVPALNLNLNGNFVGTSGTLNNLAAGVYSLYVVDAVGCRIDSTLELTQPDPLEVRDSLVGRNLCTYDKKVMAYMIATGGTPNYTFYMKPNLLTSATGEFDGLGAGSYEVTVTDRFGCSTTDEFNVGIDGDSLTVTSEVKTVTCEGLGLDGAITLHVEGGTLPYDLQWSNGALSSDTILTGLRPGTYYVEVTDSSGCKGYDTMVLDYAPCCRVELPNAFSPNGDEINNTFRPISGAGYQIVRFQIYDRWGSQVFATTDPAIGWDGKRNGAEMDLDTYYVLFTYRCLFDNRVYTIAKDVLLVR